MSYARAEEHETEDHEAEDAAGRPPAQEHHALALLMILEDGDEFRLADLLHRYPEIKEELLARAHELLGSDFVGRALAIYMGHSAAGEAAEAEESEAEEAPPEVAHELASEIKVTGVDEDGSLAVEIAQSPEEEREEVLAEVVEAAPETAAELADEANESEAEEEAAQRAEPVAEEEIESTPSETEQETEHAPASEPGWVTRARAYHAEHPDWVDEFNDLTGYICALGDGDIDPVLVSRWQVQHGVSPDGRVGPATLAAARAAGKVSPQAAVEAEPEMAVGDLGLTLE